MEHPCLRPPQVRILQAALEAVEPGAAVRRFMQRAGTRLTIVEHEYDLDRFENVYLAGGGKATAPMAQAAAQILDAYLTGGQLVTKTGHTPPGACSWPPGVVLAEAAHPIPDESSILATRSILALLDSATHNDLVLCLLSGGGSALLTAPLVPLADLQNITTQLLACGADINEINSLRKHLDAVKGGGLACAAFPARLAALILSDVIGDPLDVIASGPSVPDPSTYAQAWSVLEKYGLEPPESICKHLQKGRCGEIPETPKPGDTRFEHVQNVVIGSNRLAVEAACTQASLEGYNAYLLPASLEGEASLAGRDMAALARQVTGGHGPVQPPACLIAGGETTVTLGAAPGVGGRNQELALAAMEGLAGLAGVTLVALATDGGDGPTDAAGAVVTSGTREQAQRLGFEPLDFLSRHDAYHFFEAVGGLLKTGPTRTNVNDLVFLFVE